jgi:hypothetical protein
VASTGWFPHASLAMANHDHSIVQAPVVQLGIPSFIFALGGMLIMSSFWPGILIITISIGLIVYLTIKIYPSKSIQRRATILGATIAYILIWTVFWIPVWNMQDTLLAVPGDIPNGTEIIGFKLKPRYPPIVFVLENATTSKM